MSEFAYDVTIETFEARALQPSLEVPVIVDFWAPWCQPCQTLTPILEKLANEYKGRFLLAKVNADEQQELAQHFGVRSIPSLKALVAGRLVAELNDAPTEANVRAFIERVVPPPAADLRTQAAELRKNGDLEAALDVLFEACQQEVRDEGALLDAAEILLELGKVEDARPIIAETYEKEADRAKALRTRLELIDNAADTGEIEARIAANPDDHAARLELSAALAGAGRFREALEAAMEVVRRDRFFNEGAARAAILKIFEALAGNETHDDLVREYRRALSAALN